jgi:hypothetical protein
MGQPPKIVCWPFGWLPRALPRSVAGIKNLLRQNQLVLARPAQPVFLSGVFNDKDVVSPEKLSARDTSSFPRLPGRAGGLMVFY